MDVGVNLRYLGGISGDVGAYIWQDLLLVSCGVCIYFFSEFMDCTWVRCIGGVYRLHSVVSVVFPLLLQWVIWCIYKPKVKSACTV